MKAECQSSACLPVEHEVAVVQLFMQNPESTLLHLRQVRMRHVVAGSLLPVVYGCKYLVDVRVDALLVVVIDERLLGGI